MAMKKLMATIMSFAVAGTLLAGCSSSGNGSVDTTTSTNGATDTSVSSDTASSTPIELTVWGSQEDQEMIKKMCEDFAAANTGKTYKFTYGVVSEADAKNEVLKDVSAAADVFGFASDQTAELVEAGALYRVTKNKEDIIANNTEASISAATVNGELYGYPSSSDTYFMYYDKSKFTEDEVQSLDTMLEKNIDGVTTNVAFDLDNGWYQCAFFFGAGCTLFGENGADPTQCTFNNDRGLLVGEYLIGLASNPKFGNNFDDGLVKAGFADGSLAAAISGTWNAAEIQASLGDNYAATKLPTFTMSNGEKVQMGGMANFKLVGVNSETKQPLEAMALAEWLTNYDNQLTRFKERSFAPTNTTLANDTAALSANIAVSALAQQAQYATVQTSIPQSGNYWKPAEAFGQDLISGAVTKENLQSKLDAYVESILATLS